MTRSPTLIREIAFAAIRAELDPRPDLLGAPRTPSWRRHPAPQPSAVVRPHPVLIAAE